VLLLAPVALVSAALGATPEVHWSNLPAPGTPPARFYVDGEELVVAASDGSLHRWQGSEWIQLAEPPPGNEDLPRGLGEDPEGTTWLVTMEYAWSWRPERGWSQREPMPIGYAFDLGFDAHGAPWAVGIHGYVARRGEDGWDRLRSLPLGDGVDSNLTKIVFDRDGIGWAYEHYGQLLRIDGDSGERIHLHDEAPIQVTLDAQGRALLLGKTARYLDDPQGETVIPHHLRHVYQHEDGWWVNIDGSVHWYEDGELTPYPMPATETLQGLLATDSGKLYAWDTGGNIYQTSPGRAPVLREVAEEWGLAALGDSAGTWVADMDRDGLDDLLVLSATGDLQLLLQQDDGFVEATASWGLDLAPTHKLAVCDLDGNGQPDLVAREPITDLGESGGRAFRLRYLRTLNGWFEDATDDIQGPSYPAVTLGTGVLTCADVDADGDQDLIVAGGQRSLPPGPRVVLYENVGQGHLVSQDMPVHGLGMAWGGWVEQVLPGDMDNDGTLDFVGVVWWNRGHMLLQGTPGGGLRDATEGSGLDGLYADPVRGWIAPIDDDPYPDLLIHDRSDFVHIWRSGPDLVLDHASQALGLAPFHRVGAPAINDVELGDLDGDGHPDLLASSVENGLIFLAGSAAGTFTDHSDILPRPERKPVDVVLLDLGGDGDQDLLVLTEGQDLLLEQLSPPRASPPPPAARPIGAELVRRLDWLRPGQDLPLLALLLVSFLLAFVLAWRVRSRVLFGHGLKALAALSLAAGSYLLAMDSPLFTRSLLSLGASAAALAGSWVERRYHLYASADKLGSYRLLRYLGAGGMGTVFEASSPVHSRNVAVKILDRELTQDLAHRVQFRSEALAMAAIDDARVVGIEGSHSEERFENGARVFVEYLVMELVEGASLRDLLNRRTRLLPGEAAWVMKEVAEVLDKMHGTEVILTEDVRGKGAEEPPVEDEDTVEGEASTESEDGKEQDKVEEPKRLVHRDIKPDNIMITREGGVKLMDFGAVKAISDKSRTMAQLIGTEAYIPPEVRDGREHNAQSDLWAMGITLYELICGCRPFEHENAAKLIKMIDDDEPVPPHERVEGVDTGLSALIMHCLRKQRADRIETAGELARRLTPYATQPVVLHKEDLSSMRREAPGTKLALLPQGRALDQLDIAWVLTRSWWSWSRSSDEAVFDSLLATLIQRSINTQGGPDSLVQHLEKKGVQITTSSIQPPRRQRKDAQRVVIGAPQGSGPGRRGRRTPAQPPPKTRIEGDEA
jgi:serine/threonine protein kinase